MARGGAGCRRLEASEAHFELVRGAEVTGLQPVKSFTDLRLGDRVVHRVVSSRYARHTLHRIKRRLELPEVRHMVRASSAREHRASVHSLPPSAPRDAKAAHGVGSLGCDPSPLPLPLKDTRAASKACSWTPEASAYEYRHALSQ